MTGDSTGDNEHSSDRDRTQIHMYSNLATPIVAIHLKISNYIPHAGYC